MTSVFVDARQIPEYRDTMAEVLEADFSSMYHTWLTSVDSDGCVKGGVIYSRFGDANCEMSVVVLHPCAVRAALLRAYFSYPFDQLRLHRVTAIVRASNTKSLDFCRRLGFEFEAHLRKWYEHEDALQLVMFRETCKWLK